jgi:hypothetical protein
MILFMLLSPGLVFDFYCRFVVVVVVKTILKHLQIAVNDFEKFDFVVESATSLAEIVCRYAIFEVVYLQSSSPAADELRRALVKMYAAIMIYLSKVRSYFEQKTASKSSVLAREYRY